MQPAGTPRHGLGAHRAAGRDEAGGRGHWLGYREAVAGLWVEASELQVQAYAADLSLQIVEEAGPAAPVADETDADDRPRLERHADHGGTRGGGRTVRGL